MPRRRQDDEVAERAGETLDQQRERRREPAGLGAQTRRQRRQQQEAEAQPQPAAESPTRAPTARRSRPRAHRGMLTVAIRGPLAERTREVAEGAGLTLAKLLQDAILVYVDRMADGYEPGRRLDEWSAEHSEASRAS